MVEGDVVAHTVGVGAELAVGQLDYAPEAREPLAGVTPQVNAGTARLTLTPRPALRGFGEFGIFLRRVVGLRVNVDHQGVEFLVWFHWRYCLGFQILVK